MRKKINGHFKINVFICILLFAALSAGISSGSNNFVLTEENSDVIVSYFSGENNFDAIVSDSFFKNMKLMLWILVSAMSLTGIPVILYLLFSCGASVGAAVCALVSASNSNVLTVVLKLLPQIAFLMAALMLLSYYSFVFSGSLCVKIFLRKNRYVKKEASIVILAVIFLISTVFCYFSALCEGWFIPVLN